jgi:hypothetical protein
VHVGAPSAINFRQCTPPAEFSATLPPIVQAIWKRTDQACTAGGERTGYHQESC